MEAEFWARHLKNTFDSYELCFIRERDKKYEAADGQLLGIELKEEEGISLRGIKDGKMAFSYTYERGEKAVSALVENAKLLMPFLEKDPFYALPGAYDRYPDLDLYDRKGLSVEDDVKISALVEMESIIRTFDKRITTTRNCELHESELNVRIINSAGLEARAEKTVYALGAMAVAAEHGEEVSWYDWSWSSKYGDLDGQSLGKRVAEKTVSFLAGQVLDTGTYSGLLTPGAACQILEILAPSFLSENLYKNKTRLKDKTGMKCFSDLLSIIDSGNRGIDAFVFDGEGVPSRENVLVRQGVFEDFLYDTYYGNRLKAASTGNSVRSGIKDPPRCGTRGFFIENGRDGNAIEGFDKGLVIEELMGTHTANAVTGDFSVGAIGHLLSGGSKTPFKGIILSGNLFDILMNVKAMGNDLTFYGSYGAPTLMIEGLKISGK
jgi:PmbA protein